MSVPALAVDQRGLVRSLVRACRPTQWVKNGLVLAAPLAAGVTLRPGVLGRTSLALLAFTLVASGLYLVNDLIDRDLDRAHPSKRLRPVASGAVPEPVAAATAGVLLVAGLGTAAAVGAPLLAVVGGYAGLTLAYALTLKGLPWVELGVVASGFVLRAFAGAVAARVDASEWFLLVVSAAAVHVVASKRASELAESDARTRPVLARYSARSLRTTRTTSAALLVAAYAGWALNRPGTMATALALASLLPVAAVLLRWSRQTEQGATGAPEETLLHDVVVRYGVAAWLGCFALTVLAGTWHA